MKKIIITILIVVLLGGIGLGYKFFFSEGESNFSVVEAKVEDIVEKVSATGSVVPSKRIKIEPKVKEEVEEVAVEVSDEVEEGELLIKLDSEEAQIQVNKSRSNLESVKEEINLLETQLGNTEKDLEQTKKNMNQNIQEAQSSLEESQINLENKKQNLEDVKETEENNIVQIYEDARTNLNSNLSTAQTAFIKLSNISDEYFTTNDQISLKVRNKEEKAKIALEEAKDLIKEVEETENQEKTKEALSKLKDALDKLKEALRYTRDEASESILYKNDVSSTDKTTLETQKSNIETAISNIITTKQNITTQEISSQKNINLAEAQVNSAEAQVNSARESLESVKFQKEQKVSQTESKIEELKQQLNLKNSKLTTTRTDLNQAQKNLEDTTINAPIKGMVTEINIEEGETAKPGQIIIEIIPQENYKIEADVSEVDMAEIRIGDKTNVDFDAFPDEDYIGKISKVYPAEIVKQGVVYYRIEAELNNYPEKLKSGLTANLEIITNKKEDALVVPYVAVKQDDDGHYVQIVKNSGVKEERRVEVGLEGETMVEIKEGIKEGEKVVTYSND